jgi:hypothetical protein
VRLLPASRIGLVGTLPLCHLVLLRKVRPGGCFSRTARSVERRQNPDELSILAVGCAQCQRRRAETSCGTVRPAHATGTAESLSPVRFLPQRFPHLWKTLWKNAG